MKFLIPAVFFICFFAAAPAWAEALSDAPLSQIIYDKAQPDLSVGVIEENLYQVGDLYEQGQILEFYPRAVIFKNLETFDTVKCPVFETKIDSQTRRRAVHFFIYKQMKSIYEAQVAYRHKFGDEYAPSINELVEQGFLRGFDGGIKEGYEFTISEVTQTRRLAMFPRQAAFWAVASPLDKESEYYYFSVNDLGEVRYSETRTGVSWGPVWEYNDPSQPPLKKIIREV